LAELKSLEKLLVQEAAKRLDSYWQTEVYLPVKYLSDDETRKSLYGPQGLIITFLAGRAAPFVQMQGANGYRASTWRGITFPFTEDFLRLASISGIGAGSQTLLDSYPVQLEIQATVVDNNATEKPQKTTLTLRAPDGVQILENYNFPSSKTFTWKPGIPAEASIEIDLPSVSLYISYDGENGFPSFLNDLLTQGFTLRPVDFPDHKDQLIALGISEIKVLMKADGALPVINFLNLNRLPLPPSIIKGNDVSAHP
jgi:type VI secretion system protein ImpL